MLLMLIVFKPLDKNYMFRRVKKYGVEDDLRLLASYIHEVIIDGWRYEGICDVIDWYYVFSSYYLNLHQDMDRYIPDILWRDLKREE